MARHTASTLVWILSLDFNSSLTRQTIYITFLGMQSDDKDNKDKKESKRKKDAGSTKV